MNHQPNSLAERDASHMIHPYTDLAAHQEKGPLVITQGEGVWVTDEDGKRYLEGLSGLWCASLGFNNQRLADAAYRQLNSLPYMHIFAHRAHAPAIELSEKLARLAPDNINRTFFVNSGSEAIDTAIKLIWYVQNARGKSQKKRIIARRRAYHGITLAAGHLTGLPYARAGFDLPMSDRFYHLTPPSFYREGRADETIDAFSDRLANELETLILSLGPETIAAFVAEPVQGAGGVIVPPSDYFAKIQPILKKYDILMVADEVICGFGRTGTMFGSEQFQVKPDMMTIAKQLSSAYLPIAGVMISDEIYDTLEKRSRELGTFGMGYTYSGHPVSAAVALETLKIYEEIDILGCVNNVSPYFIERLKKLEQHDLVGEARGIGLLGGIEIVKDKNTREQFDPAAKTAMRIAQLCMNHGLIVRPIPGDAIGICPPLIIRQEEIAQLFDRLELALDEGIKERNNNMA